jgi:uridylate kinase
MGQTTPKLPSKRNQIMGIQSGQRVLLKISGEFLQGQETHGICWKTLDHICHMLAELMAYQWVIMVGGGNFFRGHQGAAYCGQGVSDQMGMMSTHFNGIALAAGLSRAGVKVCLMTARNVDGVGEIFNVMGAQRALDDGLVVICTGGLGHGAMTTDTAAVVRACELDCHWILKGTSVKGVYDKDPKKYPDALFHSHICYDQAIGNNLAVADMAALTLAKAHNKTMVVFSLKNPMGLIGLMQGKMECSRISVAKVY